jgi:hypothetical protein
MSKSCNDYVRFDEYILDIIKGIKECPTCNGLVTGQEHTIIEMIPRHIEGSIYDSYSLICPVCGYGIASSGKDKA